MKKLYSWLGRNAWSIYLGFSIVCKVTIIEYFIILIPTILLNSLAVYFYIKEFKERYEDKI